MKYLVLIFTLLLSINLIAQKDYQVIMLPDSTFVIADADEEQAQGKDTAQTISDLLSLIESKQNEYGHKLYRTYLVNRERLSANRTLVRFTSDTSYVKYALQKFQSRLTGDWLIRHDSIEQITINQNGRVIGGPEGRIIPFANSYIELRNSTLGDNLIFFRDFAFPRRRYIHIAPDGKRIFLTQRR